MDRRLGGFQSRSGHCGIEKSLLPMTRTEPKFFGCPAHTPVTIITEISLNYGLYNKTFQQIHYFQMMESMNLIFNYIVYDVKYV
jgi:hypothetical protein